MRKIWFFTPQTFFEVLAGIFVNLTSGWFGVLIVGPPLLRASPDEYFALLKYNVPSAIFGLVLSLWLTQKSKEV